MSAMNIRIKIERSDDGVVLRIVDERGGDVVEPIVLPFTEAEKLGRRLIYEGKTGATQTSLLTKKLADLEHHIYLIAQKLSNLEARVNDLSEAVERIRQGLESLQQ